MTHERWAIKVTGSGHTVSFGHSWASLVSFSLLSPILKASHRLSATHSVLNEWKSDQSNKSRKVYCSELCPHKHMRAARVNHPTLEAWHNVDHSQTPAIRACRLFQFMYNMLLCLKTIRKKENGKLPDCISYLSGCFLSDAGAWWWWADAESSASRTPGNLFQYSWHYIIARRAGGARGWGCTQRAPLIGGGRSLFLSSDWMEPLGSWTFTFYSGFLNWPWGWL